MLLLSSKHSPPPRPALYAPLGASRSRVGLCPLRLLLDRLSDFCGLLWRFYGRDTLHQPGNDPTGLGVRLALGLQLLSECGDKLGGTVLGCRGALVAALVGALVMTWARLVVA